MKQLTLDGIPAFPPIPLDMPDEVVSTISSEAMAVRLSIDFAQDYYRVSLRSVAKLCGWKRHSYLSEIASEGSHKTMPDKKVDIFTRATGCNLLSQYRLRQKILRGLSGRATVHDIRKRSVELMIAAHDRRKAA